MRKTKPITTGFELDDDVVDPKSQRRPLHQGETVPPVPSLYEQLEMAAKALDRSRPKTR